MTIVSASAADTMLGDGMRPETANDRLRKTLQSFATGVTIVTTAQSATPIGLTVNSFTSVSLNPALVLWCLRRESPTLTTFDTADHFTINILAANQTDLAKRFASKHPDRFDGVGYGYGTAGQPILEGTSAWLICRRQPVRPTVGDHVVYFGEVVAHQSTNRPPLVFANGKYGPTTN